MIEATEQEPQEQRCYADNDLQAPTKRLSTAERAASPVQLQILICTNMPYYDTSHKFQLLMENCNPHTRPHWVPVKKMDLDDPIGGQDPYIMAKELTAYESELYFRITRRDCELSAKNGPTGAVADVAYAQRMIARWVVKSILVLDQAVPRANAMGMWLKTAWHCCRLGNYSTPYAILRGLGNDWIYGLPKTNEYMREEECLADLQERLDSSNNYAKVRALIADPRKLAWCVPPLEAYFQHFDKPIAVSHYLRKQSFSDAPITDEIPEGEDDPDQLRPRYAFIRNEFVQEYVMEWLKQAETTSDEWLESRYRELQEQEALIAKQYYEYAYY